MSIHMFCASPRIGREKDNVQDIIRALENIDETEDILLIMSHMAIMGLDVQNYTSRYDFFLRQEQALLLLQSQLRAHQSVLVGVFHADGVLPYLINIQGRSLLTAPYVFESQGERYSIFAVLAQSLLLCDSQPDILIIWNTEPFQTIPQDKKKVSLSFRRLEEEYLLKENLSECCKELEHSLIVCVPVWGQNRGYLWNGLFGLCRGQQIKLGKIIPKTVLPLVVNGSMPKGENTDISRLPMERILVSICDYIRTYIEDIGVGGVIVGLSGGIDSSVVAALATQALGAHRVFGVLLPGPFSSDHSILDAEKLSHNLGISYVKHDIIPLYEEAKRTMRSTLQPLTLENLQARIRGLLLMTYSNDKGFLVLNTCNKSEDLVGYNTLYGDSIGAISPLGDLYKTEVYELAQYLNIRSQKKLIPEEILKKAPSAELRANQKDTDSLPPYDILDRFLQFVFEFSQNPDSEFPELSAIEVQDILKKVFGSQFKRQQAPQIFHIGPKILSRETSLWLSNGNPSSSISWAEMLSLTGWSESHSWNQ